MRIRVRDVLGATADITGVTRRAILESARYPSQSRARLIFYYVAAERIGASQERIGEVANRDRTTICAGIQHVEELIAGGHVRKETLDKIAERARERAIEFWGSFTPIAKEGKSHARCDGLASGDVG